jgi:hypothetical protein
MEHSRELRSKKKKALKAVGRFSTEDWSRRSEVRGRRSEGQNVRR